MAGGPTVVGMRSTPLTFDNAGAAAGTGNITVAWNGGILPQDGALILVLAYCMSQFFGTPAQVFAPAGFTGLDAVGNLSPPPNTTAQTFYRVASNEPTSYFWRMAGFGEGTGVVMLAYDNATLYEHSLAIDSFLAPPWPIPSVATVQSAYTLVGMWGFAGDQNTSGSGGLGTLSATQRARSSVALSDVGGSDTTTTGTPTLMGYQASGPAATVEAIARATFVIK